MRLFQSLKEVVSHLAPWTGCWAVCGGIAACIYRDTPRYTGDIDIAIVDHADLGASEIAESIVRALNYKPKIGFVTDQYGKLIQSRALIMGRETVAGSYIGIDFLLPSLAWIPDAVKHAQSNQLDFGFAKLPTITPEDLFIAKLFALQGTPTRTTDLDDLLSIARTQVVLDKEYLDIATQKYNLSIPTSVKELLG